MVGSSAEVKIEHSHRHHARSSSLQLQWLSVLVRRASCAAQYSVALEFEIRMAFILKFYRNLESEFVFGDDDVNSESKIF